MYLPGQALTRRAARVRITLGDRNILIRCVIVLRAITFRQQCRRVWAVLFLLSQPGSRPYTVPALVISVLYQE